MPLEKIWVNNEENMGGDIILTSGTGYRKGHTYTVRSVTVETLTFPSNHKDRRNAEISKTGFPLQKLNNLS